MEDRLTIGQLAAIFDMDIQILRHYDAKGLLLPMQRDPDNHRRYYSIDQIYTLATIRYLRKLGYSLKQIDAFMKAENLQNTVATLQEQSTAIRKQCEELIQTNSIIQNKLAFIKKEIPLIQEDTYIVKEYPKRLYVLIGEEKTLFTHDLFYLFPTVVIYRDNQKLFGAYLYEDHNNAENIGIQYINNIEEILPGRYLTGYHHGPFTDIRRSIGKMRRENPQYKFDEAAIAINIIDQFVENSPENYQTELQIRILE